MKKNHDAIEPLEARIAPAVFTVSTLADSGNGSLRQAIANANNNLSSGDTIVFDHLVGGKTVPLTGTIKLLSPLPFIADGVAIIGPVPGSSSGITINLNKHGDLTIGTTSGDVALNDLTITNGLAAFGGGLYINDGGKNIAITDCTITGNHAVGPIAGNVAYGGGIDIQAGTVTIQNSKITGNSAVGANGNALASAGNAGGGGIACFDTVVIKNSLISGNTVTGGTATAPGTGYDGGNASGGGVYGHAASVTIDSSVISGNKATGGNGASGSHGGAGSAGSAGANGGNGAKGQNGGYGGKAVGGGVGIIDAGSLDITGSTISGNTLLSGNGGAGGVGGKGGAGGSGAGQMHVGAGGDGGAGGIGGASGDPHGAGIYAYTHSSGLTLSVDNSTISGNTAATGKAGAGGAGGAAGAGSYTQSGHVHKGSPGAKGATGAQNGAEGGGIWAAQYFLTSTGTESVTLSQVTIANNAAQSGGGIYLYNGVGTQIDNCTISQNTATGNGGGMSGNDVANVTSSIIAGNTAPSDSDISEGINAVNDLIGKVTGGTVLFTDTNNQKGTLARPLDPMLGPLGLHDGGTTATMLPSFLSAAIGNGSNPDSLDTDQNGEPRVTSSLYDIGAVEEGGAQAFVVTTLADNATGAPIPGSLRAEIIAANTNHTTDDTIVFDHVVGGKTVPLTGTIKLLQPLPQITDGVTIIGPTPGSAKGLTINLNKQGDLSFGATPGHAGLSDLTITNGLAQFGGGVYINDSNKNITITDCTITGNHAAAPAGALSRNASGGGIDAKNGTLTILNSTITGNTVVAANGTVAHPGGGYASGGGIYTRFVLTVANSLISGNSVTGGSALPGSGEYGGSASGGGIQGNGAVMTVDSSVISGNKLTGGNGASGIPGSTGAAGDPGGNGVAGTDGGSGGVGGGVTGGGIRDINGGGILINASTVSGNTILSGNGGAGAAGGKGGAGGHATTMGHAGKGGDGGAGGSGGNSGGSYGAGVESYAGSNDESVYISASTISGNTATSGKAGAGGAGGAAGAGSYTQSGHVQKGTAGLHGGAGNASESTGGGIWAGAFSGSSVETVTLSQVTVASNTSDLGGGGYFYGGTPNDSVTIHNCTIAGNKAAQVGGGLFAAGNDMDLEMISTIVAKNIAPGDADVAGIIHASYSLIGQVTSDTIIDGDTNNLKGTSAAPLDPLLGTLGLHDGGRTETMLLSFLSEAISAGSNPDSLQTDQNGNPRTILGGIDMGAVEEG